VELLPHVVLGDAEVQRVPHVDETDRLENLGEEEHSSSTSVFVIRLRDPASCSGPPTAQMLMLKNGVCSTMMYLMLNTCRRTIFTITASMLTMRNAVSAKRAMPQRRMKSSKSAPFTYLQSQ